jgi:GT2 family glycosyltransferase
MVGWAIQEKIGAVGAKLLYKNWTVMHGGLITGIEGGIGIAHRGMGREALGNIFRNRFPGNFSAVSACFMTIERKKFVELGGFDAELFPEHLFDADLCLRLGKSGRRSVVTTYAELMQSIDQTPKILSERASGKECENFTKKWPAYLFSDPFYNPNLSKKKADFSLDL